LGAALGLAVLLVGLLYQRQRVVRAIHDKDQALLQQKEAEAQQQEAETLNAIYRSQEAERQRIAKDLHDRLGSMLAATKLFFNAAKLQTELSTELQKAEHQLDQLADETRKIAHNMASDVLTEQGLAAALHNWKAGLDGLQHLEVHVEVVNVHERLPKGVEVGLYRVVQELVSNVMRHARASELSVQLTQHADRSVTLMVEDDGQGFEPAALNGKGGIGLKNIQKRVADLKGNIHIDSQPGYGTTVTIDVPPKL